MSNVPKLTTRIGANITEFSNKMNDVVRQAKKAAGDVERQFKGLGEIGKGLSNIGTKLTVGITVPLTLLGAASVKAAASMETSKVAFETMLKSASDADKMLKNLRDFAKSTPFGFPELASSTRKMLALGFSAQEVIPTLTKVGNASSALGLGAQGVDRIVLALGQMRLKGKASGEEMKQLVESGVDAWGALAKALNTNVAGAMNLVQKKMIDGKVAAQIIMDEMGRSFEGGMEKQSKTLEGKWSNILDSLKDKAAEFGEIIASSLDISGKLDSIDRLLEKFSALPKEVKATIVNLALFAATLGVVTLAAGKFILAGKEIAKAFAWLRASTLGTAILGLSTPFAAVAIAAGTVVYKLDSIREAWTRLKKEWREDRFLNELQGIVFGSRADMDDALRSNLSSKMPKAPAFAYEPSKPSSGGGGGGNNALTDAMKLYGIKAGLSLKQLESALALVRAEFLKGRIPVDDYSKALSEFTEASFAAQNPALMMQLAVMKLDAENRNLLKPLVDVNKQMQEDALVQQKVAKSTFFLSDAYKRVSERMLALVGNAQSLARANKAVADTKDQIAAILKPFEDMDDKVRALGVTTEDELNKRVADTAKLYKKMYESGMYTYRDLTRVEYELLKAKEANGTATEAELQRLVQLKGLVDSWGRSVVDVNEKVGSLSREISTVITTMNQGIADSIVHWKGLGNVAVSTLQQIGKAIIAHILSNFVLTEQRIKKVGDAIAGVFTKAKKAEDLGKKAADKAASTVGAGADVASQAGKSLASASRVVSSALTSTVTAVAGVVSAVTGVIGLFQSRAMNKSLDIVVKHTLETTNEIRNLRADQWTRHTDLFHKLDDIWSTLLRGVPMASGNLVAVGGGTTTNNITFNYPMVWDTPNLERLADELLRIMRLRGIVK